MASKAFLITMAFLALSLIISSEVTARDLAETTAAEAVNEPEETSHNEADVGEVQYGGGYGGYRGGGYGGYRGGGGGYRGGYPGGGYGGYRGGGGGYRGGYPGGGYGGYRGGGGYGGYRGGGGHRGGIP